MEPANVAVCPHTAAASGCLRARLMHLEQSIRILRLYITCSAGCSILQLIFPPLQL